MKFVDLANYGFVTEPRYYFYGWSDSAKVLTRPSLVELLLKAKSFLPKGYNFKVWDGQRSLEVQLKMIENFRRRLKHVNPGLKKIELERSIDAFCAKPLKVVERLDTHRHGGALDLTIIDSEGRELYMGSDFDDATEKAATNYFEQKKVLNKFEHEARKNRRLLIKTLSKVGLANYPNEWWHWSSDK